MSMSRPRWCEHPLTLAVLVLLCHGCSVSKAAETKTPATIAYGAALGKEAKAIPLNEVLTSPDTFVGKTVLVDGHVRAACTKKGCWMELSPSSEAKTQGCRVTFKDYGFFVPKDSAGATARLEGVVAIKVIPKDQIAHYESEGAHFAAKAADGSAREITIVASGVELTR